MEILEKKRVPRTTTKKKKKNFFFKKAKKERREKKGGRKSEDCRNVSESALSEELIKKTLGKVESMSRMH